MSWSSGANVLAPLVRLAPRSPGPRLVLLVADVALFNFLLYSALRSLLLQPIGYASAWQTAAWICAFVALLPLLHALKPRAGRIRLFGLAFEWAACAVMFAAAAFAASFTTTEKGFDYSWLRVEMVKTPLWFAMFTRAYPWFTAFAVGSALLLAWGTLRTPRSKWALLLPGAAVAALVPLVVRTFAPLVDFAGFYVVAFCAPIVLFWILLVSGATVWAFRLFPFVLHAELIALSYIGFLPGTALAPEFVCEAPGCGPQHPNPFGVSRLFPNDNRKPDPSFTFLRKMVLSSERAYFSYGPTCGVYSVQRDTGVLQRLPMKGLVRDLGWSPNRRELWATNWMTGDFMAIQPQTLKRLGAADLFEHGIRTPWGFAVDYDSGRVYMSNVTPPIISELTVEGAGKQRRVHVSRSIDFHASGYTRFTDGAFGLHVDPAHDRLYVLVGMLEGRFELGLVEIELSSFRVLRDLRLPAGTALVPVRGRDTALLPSYYYDSIYEVSLRDMKLLRTIRAAPTITVVEQDEQRGLFYATSRTTGELLVIDDARGEVVRSFSVGAKPDALKLDNLTDQLFIGSARGVFRIDLSRFPLR